MNFLIKILNVKFYIIKKAENYKKTNFNKNSDDFINNDELVDNKSKINIL